MTATLNSAAAKEVSVMVERLNGNLTRIGDLSVSLGETFGPILSTPSPEIASSPPDEGCNAVHAETLRQYCIRLENTIVDLESILNRCEL